MADISIIQLSGMIFLLTFVLLTPLVSFQQCSQLISTFPYHENFENLNGNWVAGGTASDWAWGTPSKSVINAAGTGLKCWITGRLNNKSYSNGENSWLQTPCFDFTNIKDPYLTFKVFWETEGQYDGANLQYSIDNGATWQVVGSANETSNCIGENWFTQPALPPETMHGGFELCMLPLHASCIYVFSSGEKLMAKYDVPEVAGTSNVVFRFVFVSGTSCNDFDGFAIEIL